MRASICHRHSRAPRRRGDCSRATSPLAGVYDEMLAAPGVLRPHCERVRRDRSRRSAGTSSRRGGRAPGAAIRENGVTYNVYGDPQGVDRPWELDMVPLLDLAGGVDPPRERRSSSGRALLNLILADLYGPQTLLRDGLLPPSLVFGNPAFLRPCHGIARAARHPPAPARRRSGALARRPMVGARRPHAGAVRRRIRAREPDRAVAQPARSVPRLPGAAAGVVLPRAARHADGAGAAARRASRGSCC